MKHIAVLVSLILPGLVAGCMSDRELQSLRADSSALERQNFDRQQGSESRYQNLNDRVAQFEKNQAETRRDLARVTATLDELRVQLQRLQGDIQETQYRARRGASGEAGSGAKGADVETRLGDLEKQLSIRRNSTPPPQPQTKPAVEEPTKAEQATPPLLTLPPAPSTPPPQVASPAPAPPQPSPAHQAQPADQVPSGAPALPPAPPGPPPQPRVAALPPPATPSPARLPAPPSPTEGTVADQLYKRALKDYQDKNYEAAVVNFKQYLKQAPKSSQSGNAQYLVGESLYAQKQYEAAIVAFDEVVQKYGQDSKVATAMLKQGYAFAELKDARNARFFLQQVQKKYPNSPEAQQAAEKLKQLR